MQNLFSLGPIFFNEKGSNRDNLKWRDVNEGLGIGP